MLAPQRKRGCDQLGLRNYFSDVQARRHLRWTGPWPGFRNGPWCSNPRRYKDLKRDSGRRHAAVWLNPLPDAQGQGIMYQSGESQKHYM
eukprot:5778809-Amphidinium_carterae.1